MMNQQSKRDRDQKYTAKYKNRNSIHLFNSKECRSTDKQMEPELKEDKLRKGFSASLPLAQALPGELSAVQK